MGGPPCGLALALDLGTPQPRHKVELSGDVVARGGLKAPAVSKGPSSGRAALSGLSEKKGTSLTKALLCLYGLPKDLPSSCRKER